MKKEEAKEEVKEEVKEGSIERGDSLGEWRAQLESKERRRPSIPTRRTNIMFRRNPV